MMNCDIIQTMEKIEERFFELVRFDEVVEKDVGLPLIGVDEAGRGPLAGPVVAVAVQVRKNPELIGVDDSKKLSVKEREWIFGKIIEHSVYGVGISTVDEIDETNILEATRLAMRRALESLHGKNVRGFVVVDGRKMNLGFDEISVINGDGKSFSIACASILAKVIRDRIMIGFSKIYPAYLFEKHKGYPTKEHIERLKIYGPTPFHRLSFKPVLRLIDDETLRKWHKEGKLNPRRFERIKRKLREVWR